METNTDSLPAPRVPLNLPIEFRKNYARNSITGSLFNISLTGAFLRTNTQGLMLQEKINLFFKVSGRKRKITATVVWMNNNGVGVYFQPFNNRDTQIIDDLIYFVESSRATRRNVLNTIFKKVS